MIYRKIVYVVVVIILICSCKKKVLIPATKDALLSSDMPDTNYSGKHEAVPGKGYGVKKRVRDGFVTYPALYLSSSDENTAKDAFILGGFDLGAIQGEVVYARLKFFINYASVDMRNVCIFVRPVVKAWDETTITFHDIYKSVNMGSLYTDMVDYHDEKGLIIVFDLHKSSSEDFTILPCPGSRRIVSINVTKIIKRWVQDPDMYHGLLVDPMWRDDFRYVTTNKSKQIADFGVIEVGTSEWYTWDGMVPNDFTIDEYDWVDVRNESRGRMMYVPHLEVHYK